MAKVRFEGTRWRIVYGSYDGVERFAVDELQRMVQRRVPYVVEVVSAKAAPVLDDYNLLLVGTPASNNLIGDLVSRDALEAPSHAEGYAVRVLDSPWQGPKRVAAIAGADAAGVLYGVVDFSARVLAGLGGDSLGTIRKAFDNMPDVSIAEHPLVPTRGIWTWGYVIYDYRRYLDHMARLKMNSITIWNDCPPLNAPEVIAYAHSRGVKVILGFHWGWGANFSLSNAEDRRNVKASVLERYRNDYRHLDFDGIYFQTQTEHGDTVLEGRTTASRACELVNDIGGALLADNPDLYIQFGLHATAVGDRDNDLMTLDPRVTVTWEDLGALPFSYDPTANLVADAHGQYQAVPRTFDDTLAYGKRLAGLRNPKEFAAVVKGWTTLNWNEEFENHGPFILGERGRDVVRRRLEFRQTRWDYVNALWARNYSLAARFYREMLAATEGRMQIWGLIEDGVLEEKIQPSVALFAETLWNPRRTDAEIMQLAMSPYYSME